MVLYGKSAATLGNDTKRNDLDAVKAKINEAYKNKDAEALKKYVAEFEHIIGEDRSEAAQEIIDKMFQEFPMGHQWVKRMQKLATEEYYVFSPIGRIRHLYAAMTGIRQIVSRQVRRGMNAPIQGFASEIAVKASRDVMVNYYNDAQKIKKMCGLKGPSRIKFNRIVHDALYYSVPYEYVLPFMHILQYVATEGVAKSYEEQFGLKFPIEPEIEMEVGTKDTNSAKWDWNLSELLPMIDSVVKQGTDDRLLTESHKDIMAKILKPWQTDECIEFLDENYPLLNVKLAPEIRAAVKTYSKAKSKAKETADA